MVMDLKRCISRCRGGRLCPPFSPSMQMITWMWLGMMTYLSTEMPAASSESLSRHSLTMDPSGVSNTPQGRTESSAPTETGRICARTFMRAWVQIVTKYQPCSYADAGNRIFFRRTSPIFLQSLQQKLIFPLRPEHILKVMIPIGLKYLAAVWCTTWF